MKNKSLISVLFLVIFINNMFSQNKENLKITQNGQVLEHLECPSTILQSNIHYSVYLPPDYETSNRKYPVIYLLHGYSDDETAWVQFGEVNISADRLISNGEIGPVIIIMPNAKVSFYINDYLNKIKYEDAFFKEFIPFIENKYRIRAQKEFRAVSGLSMGGFGSLVYAMHHPEMFSVCVPFSAVVMTEKRMKTINNDAYQIFAETFGSYSGEQRLTEHLKRNSPYYLALNLPSSQLKSVKWYIDCGDDDFLTIENNALHDVLIERQIPHEYRVRDGAHRWNYWRTGIIDGLKFINTCFHR